MSHEYASPYAGATAPCVKTEDPLAQYFNRFTFDNLPKLQKNLGGEGCGLAITRNTETWEEKPSDNVIRNFVSQVFEAQELLKSELPRGTSFGLTYNTWTFNSPLFIANLYKFVREKGVKVIIKTLNHIDEAYLTPNTTVFNCSGLGAKHIKGIEDKSVFPTRAQVVVIRAPNINECRLHWGKDSATYMISRPGCKEVVLGGFYQRHNYNRDVLRKETEDILQRTTSMFPILGNSQDLDISGVVSAFRPSRTGGVRIENQTLAGNRTLIHNYGAVGTGFTQGLGMAQHSISLVKPAKL